MEQKDHVILLFDGVCNFCNDTVNFLLKRDKHDRFRFAPLQSEAGRGLLERFGLSTESIETLVLIEGDRCYVKSSAALRSTKHIGGLWPLLYACILVPPFLRNWAYDRFAAFRYRLFGKRDACMVPTPEIRNHFLT